MDNNTTFYVWTNGIAVPNKINVAAALNSWEEDYCRLMVAMIEYEAKQEPSNRTKMHELATPENTATLLQVAKYVLDTKYNADGYYLPLMPGNIANGLIEEQERLAEQYYDHNDVNYL